MVSTLYRLHCGFKTRLVQRKIPVLIINFFSLNFTSIEIEEESVSSRVLAKRPYLGEGEGVWLLVNEQGRTRGMGGGGGGVKTQES